MSRPHSPIVPNHLWARRARRHPGQATIKKRDLPGPLRAGAQREPADGRTTEPLGRVAAAARVKKLVLSHLVPGDDPSIMDAIGIEDVQQNCSGEIVVGRDLMMI
jgi:hypothetical protein